MRTFPFTALVGLEDVKRLLLLSVVNPALGPVAILGPPGCGKSTAIRSLTGILPSQEFMFGCLSNCPPSDGEVCDRCKEVIAAGKARKVERTIPFIQLPFSATNDTLLGSPRRVTPPDPDPWERYEPGFLALANNGLISVEKASLMPREVLDKLFSALAASKVTLESGRSRFTYPFRSNPLLELDEDALPEILKRYCRLTARAVPPNTTEDKVLVLKRVQDFETNPKAFLEEHATAVTSTRAKVSRARADLPGLTPDDTLVKVAKKMAVAVGSQDSWNVIIQAARASAALDNAPLGTETLNSVMRFMPSKAGGGK